MYHLDGVRVRRTLRRVDEFVSKALGNRLDVSEGGLASLENVGCNLFG